MGLNLALAHIAALVPVLGPAELRAFVEAAAALQGLGEKVADREVIATAASLLGGGSVTSAVGAARHRSKRKDRSG